MEKIRILILLMILFVVAVNAYRDQNQDWNKPIFVLLHPINADGLATTQQYIQQLSAQDLKGTQEYLEKAAQQYRGQPTYFYFNLGHELKELPPKVPEQASLLGTILWSLKFRFYAWQQQQGSDPSSNVTLFLNYYDPAHTQQLKHSTALQKAGLVQSIYLLQADSLTRIRLCWCMNYCIPLALQINMISLQASRYTPSVMLIPISSLYFPKPKLS